MTEMHRSAHLSHDKVYRYSLTRRWGAGPTVLWIMLNPSTADADIDDPTIRRCIGFTKRWGFEALEVVNLYAFRATDPAELVPNATRAPGPDNNAAWAEAFHRCHFVVLAWGANKFVDQGYAERRVIDINGLPDCGRPLRTLGTTKKGAPRHPLYVKADTPLQLWEPSA